MADNQNGGRATILALGIPRGGSTLVYNILRKTQTEIDVEKNHMLPGNWKDMDIFVSVRDPRDAAFSLARVQAVTARKSMTEDKIDVFLLSRAAKYVKSCTESIHQCLESDRKPVAIVRYEDFYNNYEVIFDAVDRAFGTSTSPETRLSLSAEYSVDSVKKIQEGFFDFSEWDKETQIHGFHIWDAAPGKWLDRTDEEQRSFLASELDECAKKLGY